MRYRDMPRRLAALEAAECRAFEQWMDSLPRAALQTWLQETAEALSDAGLLTRPPANMYALPADERAAYAARLEPTGDPEAQRIIRQRWQAGTGCGRNPA